MHDDAFHRRLKELYRMLFELATGNLVYRIESPERDNVSRLSESLNTFAAQMQLAIRKSGYIVPYYTYQNMAHAALILDLDLIIIGFTEDAPGHFGYGPDQLLGKPCRDLIHQNSKKQWEITAAEMQDRSGFHANLPLQFLTFSGQIQASFCSVYRLQGTTYYLLSCVTTTIKEIAELNQNAKAEVSEARTIQDLYQYIMENLEKPLPTTKELALVFKTNEFKLKQGFRHFFNSGIHAFYNSERLKRAHLLLQQTEGDIEPNSVVCAVSVNHLYGGHISLFGLRNATAEDGHHGGSGLTVRLDISKIVDELQLSNAMGENALDVLVQPVNKISEGNELTIDRISVYRKAE